MCEEVDELKYHRAISWCRKTISSADELLFDPKTFHDEMFKAAGELDYPFESLFSLLRNLHVVHVKKTVHKLRTTIHQHLCAYSDGESIVSISRRLNYPPYLMTRLIVENIVNNIGKKAVTEAMREPVAKLGDSGKILFKHEYYRKSEDFKAGAENRQRIDPFSLQPIVTEAHTSRLAFEVMEAIDADPIYGPMHDKERRISGSEHEIMLEQALINMNIPFETETQLRIRGTARTPDVLLLFPLGVKVSKRTKLDQHCNEFDWKVIYWIDSKAMFGDERTHNVDVLPQAEAFVHRFGPGLILYWFGHAPFERLEDSHGDIVVAGWKLPESFMLPNGELTSNGS